MTWRLFAVCGVIFLAAEVACGVGFGEKQFNYQSPDWGFTISYPSSVGGHPVFVNEQKREPMFGLEYMILLSDARAANPQQYDPNESFRMLALREAVTDRSLQEWAVSNWNSLGVELNSAMMGNCPELTSGEVDIGDPGRKSAGIWISQDLVYYAFIAYYKPSVQQTVQGMLSSISITGCN